MEGDSTVFYLSRTRSVINWRKFCPQYIFFHEDEMALWLNGMSKNAPSDVFPEKNCSFTTYRKRYTKECGLAQFCARRPIFVDRVYMREMARAA